LIARVEQEAPAVAVDEGGHDPDPEPRLERHQDFPVTGRCRLQSRQAVDGLAGDRGLGLEQQAHLEGVGRRGAQAERRQRPPA